MKEARLAKYLSEYQDILGQLIRLNLYTPICLCFPFEGNSTKSQVIDRLIKGLERLSYSFPWLAGQVIREGVAEGNTGLSKIIPFQKTIRLIVSHDATVPSMDTLRDAGFPSSKLDGAVLAPLEGLPTSYEDDPAPVFLIQANFIQGGLLLTFAGEHGAMDGQGLGQIIRLFSKACHDEPFTNEELLQTNRARDDIIPLLDKTTYEPGPELENLLAKPPPNPPPPVTSNDSPPKCTWIYFHFSPSSLSALKTLASLASGSDSKDRAVPYITTNDALSAFIWQATCRARHSRLPPTTTSTFARAVDIRPCLSISPFYPGVMSSHTYTTFPVSAIQSMPLSQLAASLRLALNPAQLAFETRSLATHMSLTKDLSGVNYGANLNLSNDIFFSSWAKLNCYSLDFDLGLGFPEAVRRPKFAGFEGLMYLMPMEREGGIDAAICLSDEDLERLRDDKEFGEYAKWIG